MIKASFKTQNGHYLIANDNTSGYRIRATPDGVGPWEVFTIVPADGREGDSIFSGDRIHLQTHFGRYVMALEGGGGAVTGEATLPNIWETFTIEKLSGGGEIAHGDQITLRTNDESHFLMAREGGGSDVSAVSTHRSVWETFSIQFWNPMLVRMRAFDSHYLAAEGGGRREITATRTVPYTWETFTLVNRSRKSGLHDGDLVSIQVWDGRFVWAVGGGGSNLVADRNRADSLGTFTIIKASGGEISLGDRISFRTQNGTNYVMAENGGRGVVNAVSRQAREWESFELESAELVPIDYAHIPTSTAPDRPLTPAPRRLAGTKRVLTLLIEFSDRPSDPTLTTDHIRNFLFGEGTSVRRWLESNSYGSYRITNAGIYGPIRLPWAYGAHTGAENIYWSDIISGAESLGLRFRALDTDRSGIITSNELQIVVLDFSDTSGHGMANHQGATFTTRDGVTYRGVVITGGLWVRGRPVHGRAQLDGIYSDILHEFGHDFWGPERYGTRDAVRGDLIATQTSPREWERFTVLRLSGTGAISHDERVSIRAHDSSFVAVGDEPYSFLNAGSPTVGARETFQLKRGAGVGLVNDGDGVGFLAANGKYVMAKLGGGDVVKAVAGHLREWETFHLHREAGSGVLQSGDVVTLETFNHHYVVAGIGQRTTDPVALARGYAYGGGCGLGIGGAFDIMDDNCRRTMLSAYDRIKQGWINSRIITPDNKSCYVLRPSFENAEVLVLWDPFYPDEWYVVENRQPRPGFDEIPSSGLIISWVNESPDYWSRVGADYGRYPAVISAAAPRVAPNIFIAPPTLDSLITFKRQDPSAAFVAGEVTLPRGDGSLSRFNLSFHRHADELVAVTVH
jgi:hypothetical protein